MCTAPWELLTTIIPETNHLKIIVVYYLNIW